MLLSTSSVLLLGLLARSTVVEASATANTPNKSLDLPLFNSSQLNNATPTVNLSDVLPLPIPLPYGFFVPNTDTYLRLGFGLPRHRLDPMGMTGLIAIVEHTITEGINRDGDDGFPGLIFGGRQRFVWTLGEGFSFTIRNVKGSGKYFTWGQMKNVVEGLRVYLIVGERFYSTEFKFWEGPGWWRRKPLGSGGFVVDTDREGNPFQLSGFGEGATTA